VRLADGEVLGAVGGRGLHQARPVGGGDVVVGDHPPAALRLLVTDLDHVEGALVAGADQLLERHRPQHPGVRAHRLLDQLGRDHQLPRDAVALGLDQDVRDPRPDHDRDVGDQRPRLGGPDQQLGPLLGQRPRGGRQRDVGGEVLDVLVAHGHLGVRQRGLAAGAVRDDLVVLDQQAALVQLGQRPPHRLDVGGVHGPVCLAGVDPEADPVGQVLEGVDVALHRLAAAGVEALDAVGLDVALGRQPQLLFDLQLDRQPMAVPAALAVDPVAAHGLEAREQVLEHPRLDVVHTGRAVGGRRALVEHEGLRAAPPLQGTLEDLALAPELTDPAVEGWEVEVGIDLGELRHLRLSPSRRVAVAGRTPPRGCRLSPSREGTRPGAPRYHPPCRRLADADHSQPPGQGWPLMTCRDHGRTRLRLLGRRLPRGPGGSGRSSRSGSGSGRIFGVVVPAGLPPSPARWRPCRPYSFPSSPFFHECTLRGHPAKANTRRGGRPRYNAQPACGPARRRVRWCRHAQAVGCGEPVHRPLGPMDAEDCR
jgi:hypothetical protein